MKPPLTRFLCLAAFLAACGDQPADPAPDSNPSDPDSGNMSKMDQGTDTSTVTTTTTTTDPTVEVPRPDGLPHYGSPTCRPAPERFWQLTPLQLSRTYAPLLKDPLPRMQERLAFYAVRGEPFSADPALINASTLMMAEVMAMAGELTQALLKTPKVLDGCAEGGPDAACRAKMWSNVASTTWRRPMTGEEIKEMEAFYQEMASLHNENAALSLSMRRLLVAPHVLFRAERGELDTALGRRDLNAYEMADFVSYTLTDGPPDSDLAAAAEDGTLTDPEVLQAQVDRLVNLQPDRDDSVSASIHEPQRVYGLMRFFREWLEVDKVEEALKPGLRSAVIASYYADLDKKDKRLGLVPGEERAKRWLDNEMMLFVRQVVWEGEGTLKALLTGEETYLSKTLSGYYGLPLDERVDGAFVPMTQGRRGFLMQGGFLLAHDTTSARGKFIRSKLLCQPVPDPQDDIDMDLEGQAEELSMKEGRKLSPREVRAKHLEDPNCKGCHGMIDPLGFPFDHFNEHGSYRESWDGFAIDTAGEITATARSNATVQGPAELIDQLADSPEVRACFVRQLFTFVHGRAPGMEDQCVLEDLTQKFEASGGHIRQLMSQMMTAEHSWHRTPLFDEVSP